MSLKWAFISIRIYERLWLEINLLYLCGKPIRQEASLDNSYAIVIKINTRPTISNLQYIVEHWRKANQFPADKYYHIQQGLFLIFTHHPNISCHHNA